MSALPVGSVHGRHVRSCRLRDKAESAAGTCWLARTRVLLVNDNLGATHRPSMLDAIAERYRRFALDEAHGHSPSYEALAGHVARSDRILAFLGALPADRQQPNLFFAAVRLVAGLPTDAHALDEFVEQHANSIAAVMKDRTTQTNEPGRCAVLLPVLSLLPQPLAILEVGAAAGLCLLPDHYGYNYVHRHIAPPEASRAIAPVFPCTANALTPVPTTLPQIGWRRGLDLNPLSLASRADTDWLATLVWPEQLARLERLRAAIATARHNPPLVIPGDLRTDLETALKAAPAGMTLVVFHTAVLGYVSAQSDRDAFAHTVRASGAIWISNELAGTYPDIAERTPVPRRTDRFLLAVDGEPVAWTGPHGQSIEWFGQR